MRWLIDAFTVLVSVVVLSVVGVRYLLPAEAEPIPGRAMDVRLDGSLGIDFAAGPTLIVALEEDCSYCRQSMPFYRQLTERDDIDVQVVVAVLEDSDTFGSYLASENVTPDRIIVDDGKLPVSGVPTLLFVDRQGVVTSAWMGLLSADQEAEVVALLVG